MSQKLRIESRRMPCRRVALLALIAASAAAQAPVTVTTPDGSRFWLLSSDGPPVVHWAVASLCGPLVDPANAPGLAQACMQSSLRGTWRVGSLDEAREAAALAALDRAEGDLAIAPRVDNKPPKELADRVAALRESAEALCDIQAFRRVLLSAPASDVQVVVQGNAAVLSLSTTPAGVATVAKLLADRREGQALRGAREFYEQSRGLAAEAWDRDPMATLRAEALALAFPTSPIARMGERPPSGGFTRLLAQSVWARTQHPSQVVHVLTGSFDVQVIRKALESAFTSTALPTPGAETPPRPRIGTALRRAMVPGALYPAAVLAWPLRGNEPPNDLACAVRWFADGPDSWLGRELQRRGRPQIQLKVRAPWPDPPGIGMLMIEATDAGGGAQTLADEILSLCKSTTPKEPRPGELAKVHGGLLADWQRQSGGGAGAARRMAMDLLLQPANVAQVRPPVELDYPKLPPMLQQILDGNPVLVEWRNP